MSADISLCQRIILIEHIFARLLGSITITILFL